MGLPAGSSASVSTDDRRILGPWAGVSSMLFHPNVPIPARYAAWRWEKNASWRSLSPGLP